MTQPAIEIFDKNLLKLHRTRANRDNFLVHEAAKMLADRLLDISRKFEQVFELTRFDEVLPDTPNGYDMLKSSLELHFINDLPGVFAQAIRILKPDGLLLANFFGGETLPELRQAFAEAAPDTISPRISPFIDVRDAGALLQRAGFALPVVDSEKIEVVFDDAFHLMRFLRGIGETNALTKQRKNFTGKAFLHRVNEIYAQKFATEDGVLATFEIITITAWKPAPSQPKALKPGSADANLKDFL